MKLLLAVARIFLSLVARMGACISPLNSKYKVRERLCGPWVGASCKEQLSCESDSGATPKHLWLHGASLGECKMLLSLARALKKDWPGSLEILLTTQKAEAICPLEKLADGICEIAIAPADLPSSLQKFIDEVNPVILVLGENELWPGYVSSMKKAGRKVALVSGRVRRKPIGVCLESLDFLALQKECGNWKLLDWARNGQVVAFDGRSTIDVAFVSFHKEELTAFGSLALAMVSSGKAVVLAPRRLEEIPDFTTALQSRHVPVVFWPAVKKSAVSIVNQYGCIPEVLQESRAAVVGGSFVKNPGVHDFWEPLRAGVQTFIGPCTKGAEDAASELLSRGALLQISDPASASSLLQNLSGTSEVPANGPAIQSALQAQRQKILNSYEQLLKFLSENL